MAGADDRKTVIGCPDHASAGFATGSSPPDQLPQAERNLCTVASSIGWEPLVRQNGPAVVRAAMSGFTQLLRQFA